MDTLVLWKAYDIYTDRHGRSLIVRWQCYVDGRWAKNGFWEFPLPAHEANIFERAYIELGATRVFCQLNFDLFSDKGLFF